MGTNTKVKESFIKYLAGIIDADGSLSFHFVHKKYCRLRLQISQSEAIDKKFRMLRTLESSLLGIGYLTFHGVTKADKPLGYYIIQKRRDLNLIIPRLLKHLVIKGKHFKRMVRVWNGMRGKALTDQQLLRLKKFAKWSRTCSGSVKAKNHPTNAWLAGYCDGDACFRISQLKTQKYPIMNVRIACHENDIVGLKLLQKAFKGKINTYGSRPWIKEWQRNLGISDSSFAKNFLARVLRYSIIKKYQIERILEIHNKYHKQRLNENSPAG